MDRKYDALKEFQVVKFQDRFSHVIDVLKKQGIDIKVPEATSFHIEITSDINEEQMKNIILENSKTAYSPHTKTIYIHESFTKEPQLEYHFTKRMLEHISTKKEQDKILSGVSIYSNNINYNYSLNQAIIEMVTNTLIGNEAIDEDTYKNFIIERHHLELIQSIVGLETILNSFFNSDYITLETQYEKYGTEFQPLVKQMDILTSINYDIAYSPKPGEETLATEIFKNILEAYTRKSSQIRNIEKKEEFENHIVNEQTVRGTFGTVDKFGYKGVGNNLEVFKSVIKGLESANKLLKQESVKSI